MGSPTPGPLIGFSSRESSKTIASTSLIFLSAAAMSSGIASSGRDLIHWRRSFQTSAGGQSWPPSDAGGPAATKDDARRLLLMFQIFACLLFVAIALTFGIGWGNSLLTMHITLHVSRSK